VGGGLPYAYGAAARAGEGGGRKGWRPFLALILRGRDVGEPDGSNKTGSELGGMLAHDVDADGSNKTGSELGGMLAHDVDGALVII
jgi:hypothetical protein